MGSITLCRKSCVYAIIWKNTVQRGRPQTKIWRMRIAFWTPKATNTHTQVVFPLQQCLHERLSMLRHSTLPVLLHFRNFSESFLFTFLSPEIATSINVHVPFFITTDYDVRFVVRNWFFLLVLVDSIIRLTHRHDLFFIPTNARYTHQDITAMTCSYYFWYMLILMLIV